MDDGLMGTIYLDPLKKSAWSLILNQSRYSTEADHSVTASDSDIRHLL